jgi:monoamine oxidase
MPRYCILAWLMMLLALVGCSPAPAPAPEPPKATLHQQVDVVVVGAGLSGLSTAYHLKKLGWQVQVLESTPRVGGRVRTGSYPHGVGAEVGLAEFWDGNPALDLARELNVPLERGELGVSSLFLEGKLYPLTDHPDNQAFLREVLGSDYPAYQRWDRSMQAHLKSLEEGRIDRSLQNVSMEAWLKQSGLTARGQGVVRAILEPEIGTTLSRISALDGIAEWHLFAGQGAMPNHVVGGNQKLTEALAAAVGPENIALNCQVTNILDGPQGVEVRALSSADFSNRSVRARYAVLTVPLYRLFEIQFEPRLDEEVYKAIHTQMWGAYFTAHVLLDRSAEKYWTFKGHNILPILTGGPLGVMYPGDSEDPDHVLVNLLVTGDFAEMYNSRTMSLDDVQQKLAQEFEARFPGIAPAIRRWTFYRYHPRAIAAWPVGRSRFDALSERLRRPHGHLYFGGDFTESSHSDGATRSALRIRDQIGPRSKAQPG